MTKTIDLDQYLNNGGKLELLPMNIVNFTYRSDKNIGKKVKSIEIGQKSSLNIQLYLVTFEDGKQDSYCSMWLDIVVDVVLDKKYLSLPPVADFINKLHRLGYVGASVPNLAEYFEYNWKEISSVVPAMAERCEKNSLRLTKEIKEHFNCSLFEAKSVADFYIR